MAGVATMASGVAGFCAPSSAPGCTAIRRAVAASSSSRQGALVGLRCSGESEEEKKDFIKLEKTATSWQGWGGSSTKAEVPKIELNTSNPMESAAAALKAARESPDIAKYLGTSESKVKSGITGDVELVSFQNQKIVLRLVGNFWHSRQMVFSDVSTYIKKALPMNSVMSVEIEDREQLNGFAETSKAFVDREKVTEEDLRKKEAKGVNIYGEKLENPQAAFRRKKLADQEKYDKEMARRRELEKEDESTQLAAVMAESGASMVLNAQGKKILSTEMRPEDILAEMLRK